MGEPEEHSEGWIQKENFVKSKWVDLAFRVDVTPSIYSGNPISVLKDKQLAHYHNFWPS